jgi:hypothetical protein
MDGRRLLAAGVWFRSALADRLDQGFKPAPVLFDAPLFGGLPFWSPLLFAKPALVLTHQLYQSIVFLLLCHDSKSMTHGKQSTCRPFGLCDVPKGWSDCLLHFLPASNIKWRRYSGIGRK